MDLFSAEQQRRAVYEVLALLEPLPALTRITIEELESSICVLEVTFTRPRTKPGPVMQPDAHRDPIALAERVRIGDYWHPQHIRDELHAAAGRLRVRSGWA